MTRRAHDRWARAAAQLVSRSRKRSASVRTNAPIHGFIDSSSPRNVAAVTRRSTERSRVRTVAVRTFGDRFGNCVLYPPPEAVEAALDALIGFIARHARTRPLLTGVMCITAA